MKTLLRKYWTLLLAVICLMILFAFFRDPVASRDLYERSYSDKQCFIANLL